MFDYRRGSGRRAATMAVVAGLALSFYAIPAYAGELNDSTVDSENAAVSLNFVAEDSTQVSLAETENGLSMVVLPQQNTEVAEPISSETIFKEEGSDLIAEVNDDETVDETEDVVGIDPDKVAVDDSVASGNDASEVVAVPKSEVAKDQTEETDPNEGHPENGWFTNADGVLTYWVDGAPAAPDRVWYTDGDGNRYYYVAGSVVEKPDMVCYTDEKTGAKYWYENGCYVKGHAFYVSDEYDAPGLEKGYWYWADDDGTIAHDKDTYIPNDENNRVEGGGKWVRVRSDYTMVKGEDYRTSIDDGKWHWWFFDETTGEMLKNFVYVGSNGGKWVYYDDVYGWMVYGEQYRQTKDNPSAGYHWYYFDDYTGATTHGFKWVYDSSDTYYGGKNCYYDMTMGWMLYGWQNINGTWNYFNKYTGRQCSSTNAAWSASQWLNWAGSAAGATNNRYVMVDKTNLRTMVFEREDGVWVPVQDYLCSVASANGNHGAGTIEGFWHLGLLTNAERGVTNGSVYDHGANGFGAQIDNFRNAGSTGLTWSGPALAKIENDRFAKTMYRYHYLQDQGIHSTVGGDRPEQLGKRNTDGCVRLSYTDCKWIFFEVPMYTTIRIYSDVRY